MLPLKLQQLSGTGAVVTGFSDGTDHSAMKILVPTGGGGPTDWYQMRGVADSDGDTVYWSVEGAPDPSGAEAPEAVSDIVQVKHWQV